MGCFNLKGFLSRVSIRCGDEVVFMIGLAKHTGTQHFYTMGNIVPISLPVYGTYDDYGGIENVEDTPSKRWLEENIGKIEDIVDAVRECMCEWMSSVKACMESDNKYHPMEKVRYVYDNLLKHGVTENDNLCVLMEHREVYEKWVVDSVPQNDWCNIKCLKKKLKEREKLCDEAGLLKDEEMYDLFVLALIDMDHLFGNDAYGILKLYNKKYLLDECVDELEKLQKFVWNMIYWGMNIQIPMQYSQDDKFDSDIEYHTKCIELIEKLKKKHNPEEEDWDEYEDNND